MAQIIFQVDAFSAKPFAGNPAGVCILNAAGEPEWMQQVASEMNLAETAFLYPLAGTTTPDFGLRWFTPKVEVPLCGHATLASAHILWQEGYLTPQEMVRFHTKSGVLTAQRQVDGWIELDFPAEVTPPVPAPPGLLEALRVQTPLFVGLNQARYLVEVASEQEVRELAPEIARLKAFPPGKIVVTARADKGRDYDFVSRFFAPGIGIDEDPVTGGAHCGLGPYWSEKLGKTTLSARQVSARGGYLKVRVAGARVKLLGQAITVFKAQIYA